MTHLHDEKGGSAFPTAWGNPEQGGDYVPGMALRDWFAGLAISSLYAGRGGPVQTALIEVDAELAYEIADAMLAARAKGGAE